MNRFDTKTANRFNTVAAPAATPIPTTWSRDALNLGGLPQVEGGGAATPAGIAYNTVVGLPKAAVDVAKSLGQQIARSVGAVGITAGNLPSQVTNIASKVLPGVKPVEAPFAESIPTTGNKITEALFGGKPIETVPTQITGLQKTLEPYVGKQTAGQLSAPLVLGGILLDLSGFGGGKGVKSLASGEVPEAFFKWAAKETDPLILKNGLTKIGLEEGRAAQLASQLAETKTIDEAKNAVINFEKLATPKRDYVAELKALEKSPDPVVADTAKTLGVDLSRINPMDQQSNAKSMVESITEIKPRPELGVPELPAPERPGFVKFSNQLDRLVANKTIDPSSVDVLKSIFENTNDKWLGSIKFEANPRIQRAGMAYGAELRATVKKGLADLAKKTPQGGFWKGADVEPSVVLLHEYGHLAHKYVLNAEEKQIVRDVFNSLGRAQKRSMFGLGLSDTAHARAYYAKNEKEFLVQSFAEYVMQNKVPAEKMRPMLQKLWDQLYQGLKKLVNRGRMASIEKLKPLYEKMLSGEGTKPASDFAEQAKVSYQKELQALVEEPRPPNLVTPADQALVDLAKTKIPNPEQITLPQIVDNAITDVKKKVNILDYLRTPDNVLKKIGLEENAKQIRTAYNSYLTELTKNIDKITAWSKAVPEESNGKIFEWLDGDKKIQLAPNELKVANEIKDWLASWADRLGMKPDERISEYITHIFPPGKGGEFNEELAKVIQYNIPGSVYDPFLLQRKGAQGFLRNTWQALDAYVKTATRKVNMDPALASLKDAALGLEASQMNFVKNYADRINMRPVAIDNLIDNGIKSIAGYHFGVRPTRNITATARKIVSRARLGLSFTSAFKNLTQGVNTFAELGTKYTFKGYMDLLTKGVKELKANNVLAQGFIEDRQYDAVKKFWEKFDRVTFWNFEATERVNRGAAYYGAKAKALAAGKTEAEAINYGREIAGKTQFLFGSIDTPVGMASDLVKSATQFQTFSIKQIEFLAEKLKNKEYASLARFVAAGALVFGVIGKAFGMDWTDILPSLRFGTPPLLDLPVRLFKDIAGTKNEFGQTPTVPARLRDIYNAVLTGTVPGGTQINRTIEGLKGVMQGKSTTASGNWQYRINQTPENYLRAALFGKSNLPEAQQFQENKGKTKTKTTTNRFNTY
jgi:hypothetical protein